MFQASWFIMLAMLAVAYHNGFELSIPNGPKKFPGVFLLKPFLSRKGK